MLKSYEYKKLLYMIRCNKLKGIKALDFYFSTSLIEWVSNKGF